MMGLKGFAHRHPHMHCHVCVSQTKEHMHLHGRWTQEREPYEGCGSSSPRSPTSGLKGHSLMVVHDGTGNDGLRLQRSRVSSSKANSGVHGFGSKAKRRHTDAVQNLDSARGEYGIVQYTYIPKLYTPLYYTQRATLN